MRRRHLMRLAAIWPLVSAIAPWAGMKTAFAAVRSRVRPGEAGWPSDAQWAELRTQVKGGLVSVKSPLQNCVSAASSPACIQLWKSLKNPYFLGDEIGLTQTLGWVDAWTSMPSRYAVIASSSGDVVAAVNFARKNNLRLVVKGGGHSYQGTSNAPDSLLVWTRKMNDVALHEAFLGVGCEGRVRPSRAVSVGAGAMWAKVYDAVTTQAGGYVQGGGCMTVGVAGLIQSGGFGSFSKAYGLAAGSLLEAEVVTADGVIRIANRYTHPDLYWALKGGGGGSLGVVTRVTLRVHPLPEDFGAVNMTISATSAPAFRRLIGLVVDFYRQSLSNPHWGEQLRFRPENVLKISMVFQGLTRGEAKTVWQPFLDAVDAAPTEFKTEFAPFKIVSTSARTFWSPTLIKRVLGFIATDDRTGAPSGNVFWPGDQGQAGQVLHGYGSAWLPAALLSDSNRPALCDALFAASRQSGVSLHVNKGLAGATTEALAAAKDTAMNPAVLTAFALAIVSAGEQPAYPGVPGHTPDADLARQHARAVRQAMAELYKVAPDAGSYVAESDFFKPDWQRSFWGTNYAPLLEVKERYDPDGLFTVHHGVGSERWSDDGFTRLA